MFEVFFGGARGGGKTDAMLGEFVRHAATYNENAIGIMLRRTRTQLVETIERSRVIYSKLGWQLDEQQKMWRAPNGARIRFAYLERDADADGYQGHSYTRVYVEEIGTFPNPAPILKMMATLRSGAGVPVGFRATGNPGGPGHQWVKARYITPAPGGWTIIKDPRSGLERIFIPSRLADNRYLGQDYVQRLKASGSEQLVRAWLEGDWSIVDGAYFDCWSPRMVLAPFPIPVEWVRFRSMDWGSASPFSIGWWAVVQDDYKVAEGFMLPRGAMVRYREWYGAKPQAEGGGGLKLTMAQVAEGIVRREKNDPKLTGGVLDPSAFAEDGGPSRAEQINRILIANKLPGFRKADNRRVPRAAGQTDKRGPVGGWDEMRQRMVGVKVDGERVPLIYCFDTCADSIRTIPQLQHDPVYAEDVETHSEDHAADEWRYACMSRPWLRPDRPKGEPVDAYVDARDEIDERQADSIKLL